MLLLCPLPLPAVSVHRDSALDWGLGSSLVIFVGRPLPLSLETLGRAEGDQGNGKVVEPLALESIAGSIHLGLSLTARCRRYDGGGNVEVHPLPLPPGASPALQPTFSHQSAAKVELSHKTNQWQKGKLLGSGTFGNVYEATNRHTSALCAMKEVNIIPDDSKLAECLKQLEQYCGAMIESVVHNFTRHILG